MGGLSDLVMFGFLVYAISEVLGHIEYSLDRLKDIKLWIFNIFALGFFFMLFLPVYKFFLLLSLFGMFFFIGLIFYLLYRIMKRFRSWLEKILGE